MQNVTFTFTFICLDFNQIIPGGRELKVIEIVHLGAQEDAPQWLKLYRYQTSSKCEKPVIHSTKLK